MSLRTALCLAAPLMNMRTAACGANPPLSRAVTATTLELRVLLTTKKSYVLPLHVGASGFLITPPTVLVQADDSSCCGVMFQSPAAIHGPLRVPITAASSASMALFVGPMLSPSLR